jgi:hypothetical protein
MNNNELLDARRQILVRRIRALAIKHDIAPLDRRRMYALSSACCHVVSLDGGINEIDLRSALRLAGRGLFDSFTFTTPAE